MPECLGGALGDWHCQQRLSALEEVLERGQAVYVPRSLAGFPGGTAAPDLADLLFNAARHGHATARDKLLVALLLGTGLWAVDIAALRVGDVIGANDVVDEVQVDRLKSGKPFFLTNPVVRGAIAEYVKQRGGDNNLLAAADKVGRANYLVGDLNAEGLPHRSRLIADTLGRVTARIGLPRSGLIRVAQQRLARRLLEAGAGVDLLLFVTRGRPLKCGSQILDLVGEPQAAVEALLRSGVRSALTHVL